ncbi:MAG: hypothetical protein U1F98_06275 [Verrucomicrobiota bacterium]
MNPSQYEAALEEIETVIRTHSGGHKDREATLRIELLTGRVSTLDPDPYIVDKAKELKRLSEILYSPRKHLKYANADESGVLVLRGIIISNINAMRGWPQTRANMQRVQDEAG